MGTRIHKTVVVDSTAEIAEDVSIGAYSVIGAKVRIGSGTRIMSHVVIDEGATFGRNNQVFQFSSIGAAPQDKKYAGSGARLVIGDNNVIREYCTINAGASPQTTIGNNNWFLAYVHVAHDCQIGNHTLFVNSATLAGHVEVHDYATVGASTKVHQFCRVGTHSFSRNSVLIQDLAPYVIMADNKLYGLNKSGMGRSNISKEALLALTRCYRKLFTHVNLNDPKTLQDYADQYPEVKVLLDFIRTSKRGVVGMKKGNLRL